MDENEIRKVLSAPAVVALIMASVRFMLTGNKESPIIVLGYLVGAGFLAYLAGPWMQENHYTPGQIGLACAAIGFLGPNLAAGLLALGRKFKDDPAGFIADILARVGRK